MTVAKSVLWIWIDPDIKIINLKFSNKFIHFISIIIFSFVSHQGMNCNTPSRLYLESNGLGSETLVLGRGAFGTVVLGQWRGRKVAVKVMEKEEGERSARRRKSLDSELRALQMDHENIVKVHGVFAAENKYAVILMEYVGSRNLHRQVKTFGYYFVRSRICVLQKWKRCHSCSF